MTTKPGLPIILTTTSSLTTTYGGTGALAITNANGNAVTPTANTRIWIDSIIVSISVAASNFVGGSLGGTYVQLTGTGTGQTYFSFAGPDSADGSSSPAATYAVGIPGDGMPLQIGDGLSVGRVLGVSGTVTDPSFTSIMAMGRIRPATDI